MKKQKMRAFIIEDDMYRKDFIFLIGGTSDEICKYISEKSGFYPKETIDGKYLTFTNKSGIKCRIVAIGKSKYTYDSPEFIALLAHEILHYVNDGLNDIGLKMTMDSEEAYTWYFQSSFGACLRVLKNL